MYTFTTGRLGVYEHLHFIVYLTTKGVEGHNAGAQPKPDHEIAN